MLFVQDAAVCLVGVWGKGLGFGGGGEGGSLQACGRAACKMVSLSDMLFIVAGSCTDLQSPMKILAKIH